jgi:hypothetical protein
MELQGSSKKDYRAVAVAFPLLPPEEAVIVKGPPALEGAVHNPLELIFPPVAV